MLWGAAAIFILTSALLACAFMPSTRTYLTPRRLILGAGIAFPLVVLTLLVATAFYQGEMLRAESRETPHVEIEAVARQWTWEFRYPQAAVTSNTVYIPAGRDVVFVVTSLDVVHSFWIPRLGGKIDAIPGHRNRIRLNATAEGIYRGVCAEFCGAGHADMGFTVTAVPDADYAATVQAAAEPVP